MTDFRRWERDQRRHDLRTMSDREWDAAHGGHLWVGLLFAALASCSLWIASVWLVMH